MSEYILLFANIMTTSHHVSHQTVNNDNLSKTCTDRWSSIRAFWI